MRPAGRDCVVAWKPVQPVRCSSAGAAPAPSSGRVAGSWGALEQPARTRAARRAGGRRRGAGIALLARVDVEDVVAAVGGVGAAVGAGPALERVGELRVRPAAA